MNARITSEAIEDTTQAYLEHIFDIPMSPVLAFDLGYRSNIPSTESCSWRRKNSQYYDSDDQESLERNGGERHVGFVRVGSAPSLVCCYLDLYIVKKWMGMSSMW